MTGWQSAVRACCSWCCVGKQVPARTMLSGRVSPTLSITALVLRHQLGKLWAGNGVPRISVLGMDISVEESEQRETTPSSRVLKMLTFNPPRWLYYPSAGGREQDAAGALGEPLLVPAPGGTQGEQESLRNLLQN